MKATNFSIFCNNLQIVSEAIFQSKIRYGISVNLIAKFEFNNSEQAMDPNMYCEAIGHTE